MAETNWLQPTVVSDRYANFTDENNALVDDGLYATSASNATELNVINDALTYEATRVTLSELGASVTYAEYTFNMETPRIAGGFLGDAVRIQFESSAPDLRRLWLYGFNFYEVSNISTITGFKVKVKYSQNIGVFTLDTAWIKVLFDDPDDPRVDWSILGREFKKQYIYRVYKPNGDFVAIWPDVKDEFEFTQAINTPGTTTSVHLARSAQTRKEVRGHLITAGGDKRITESSNQRVVTYETTNNVGDDTDVVENYNVDVYVYYGDDGYRVTQDGDIRITQDSKRMITSTGAPGGLRVFSGFILDYEADYGPDASDGVTVTLASHGWELSHEEVLDGTSVNVTMSTTSPEQVVKNVLDTNPGKMAWANGTLDVTGVTDTFKFQLNTKLEAIQSAFDRTPENFYWYGNVANSLVYMKQVSATADHTFILGKHIQSLKMKKSIEALVNRIYFVGGEVTPGTPSSVLFKKYEDATSISTYRKGLTRITDRRYTLATSAQKRSERTLNRYKNPVFSSPLVISAANYDIESISLGQTVQFRGFNNYIDSLPPLLIVNYGYHPYRATLQLGELLSRFYEGFADTEESLMNEQYETIPNAPS